jgi:hypothetical protein
LENRRLVQFNNTTIFLNELSTHLSKNYMKMVMKHENMVNFSFIKKKTGQTTRIYYFTHINIAFFKKIENILMKMLINRNSDIPCGDIKSCAHYGKQFCAFSKH